MTGVTSNELKVMTMTAPDGQQVFAVFLTAVDSRGNVLTMSREPTVPAGVSLHDLREELLSYLEAVDRSIEDGDVPASHTRPDGMIPSYSVGFN